ncbi:MAG TPA: LysR family transcriptional regulator [Nocardioidaceae bacterium]|nr:LysR family transcriptional regulator [Nocardioidaceae bacterium]
MTSRLSVAELMLTEAVARHGSVGAAAKELLVSQPSASRRLAALERRVGATLFDRDTTGARATAAGRELARQATRLLADLDAIPEEVLAAADAQMLSIGTIQSLSPMVFTALDAELDGVAIRSIVDHGPYLLQQVHGGFLDAAVVTIAEQIVVPQGLRRFPLGRSPLVVVLPEGAPELDAGDRPFAQRDVVYNTVDLAAEPVRERLSILGGSPRHGATVEAALRIARSRRAPALIPELAAHWYAASGDRILASPVPGELTLSLVTRPPPPTALAHAARRLSRRVLGRPG